MGSLAFARYRVNAESHTAEDKLDRLGIVFASVIDMFYALRQGDSR